MRIAAAAWPLEWHRDWNGYAEKLERWFETAEAELLVFPEYAGMEAALIEPPARDLPPDWIDHAAARAEAALALHVKLCGRYGVHCLMGSLPVRVPEGIVNRAHLISPAGAVLWQDKQVPTPWERAQTGLVAGDPPMVMETGWGRVGVLVCHDAEFPPLARALDCDLLLVPACTDTEAGATRVRNAARARALEGCCLSVLSQTLGAVEGCSFLDVNRGRAGIYAPPDRGFPGDGIVAEGELDAAGWIRADAPLEALSHLRRGRGEVAVPADWTLAEARAALAPADRRPG